jgi:hypothetical protein
MTFAEWWSDRTAGVRALKSPPTPEKAWDAATLEAAKLVREQAKRYGCKERRGIVLALADMIEASLKEGE